MTYAEVYAVDKLFATLDLTLRLIIVADVGEIPYWHLPHDLVATFKATLREMRQESLLYYILSMP